MRTSEEEEGLVNHVQLSGRLAEDFMRVEYKNGRGYFWKTLIRSPQPGRNTEDMQVSIVVFTSNEGLVEKALTFHGGDAVVIEGKLSVKSYSQGNGYTRQYWSVVLSDIA